MGRVLRTTENTRRHDTLDNGGHSRPSPDKDPGPLASGNLELLGRSNAPDVGVPADAGDGEDTVMLMMGTNDVSRGDARK